MSKLINALSRSILGIVFIFSGFVKALDPSGSAYKFSDYFQAFHLSFLDGISLEIGIFLAVLEFVLGLVLILGYQKRIVYTFVLLFMSFFTLLTLVLALTNPVSDCGCFGDALILTNWETFFKNVVLMGFVIILFKQRKSFVNVHSNKLEIGIILVFFVSTIIFSLYNHKHIPVIDFRPYSVGTNIKEAMEVPDGAQVDEYSTILYYENIKSGETEEFSIDNYPTDTTEYRFVTSESKLISQGYEPPIHDFGIQNPEGIDITNKILSDQGYTLFMVCYNLEKSNREIVQKSQVWEGIDLISDDFSFIPVTSTAGSDLEDYIKEQELNYNFFSGDEIMLKTMIRSNPGFILVKGGTIVGKWAGIDFPELSEWNNEWPEIIENFNEAQNPEIQLMIEEGILEPIEYNIIQFGSDALTLVSEYQHNRIQRLTWSIFILCIALIIALFIKIDLVQKKEFD